ncbi:hypothetical protein ACA910_018903 [Epithemia clementina (nom. ined.)]
MRMIAATRLTTTARKQVLPNHPYYWIHHQQPPPRALSTLVRARRQVVFGLLDLNFDNHQKKTTTTTTTTTTNNQNGRDSFRSLQQRRQLHHHLFLSRQDKDTTNKSTQGRSCNLLRSRSFVCGGGGTLDGTPRRGYHATSRREIVPLIGVSIVVLVMGRYSWRAWRRMEEEWDDYEFKLLQYEKEKAMRQEHDDDTTNDQGDSSTTTTTTTLAIDFGTISTKLAAYPPLQVLVTREGHRSFFNGILYDNDTNSDSPSESQRLQVQRRGLAALERFYYDDDHDNKSSARKGAVVLPFRLQQAQQQQQQGESLSSWPTLPQVVHDVLAPTLQESADRLDCSFSRFVVTLPIGILFHSSSSSSSSSLTAAAETAALYRQALEQTLLTDEEDDEKSIVWIPDAVAAVWGAQRAKLLPLWPPHHPFKDQTSNAPKQATRNTVVVVVDIGGFATQFSLVQNDIVVVSTSIPLGGETLIELLQHHVMEQEGANLQWLLKDDTSRAHILSLLQMHARTALSELSFQPQAKIHIPFLYAAAAAAQQHQSNQGSNNSNATNSSSISSPHLDCTVSRSVLEELVQAIPSSSSSSSLDFSHAVSPHFPPPTNLTWLFTSILTQLLEQGETLPSHVNHFLLVGGASRFPFMRQTVKGSLEMLLGTALSSSSSSSVLVMVPDEEASLASELTVLGASAVPLQYDYDLQEGLRLKERRS